MCPLDLLQVAASVLAIQDAFDLESKYGSVLHIPMINKGSIWGGSPLSGGGGCFKLNLLIKGLGPNKGCFIE